MDVSRLGSDSLPWSPKNDVWILGFSGSVKPTTGSNQSNGGFVLLGGRLFSSNICICEVTYCSREDWGTLRDFVVEKLLLQSWEDLLKIFQKQILEHARACFAFGRASAQRPRVPVQSAEPKSCSRRVLSPAERPCSAFWEMWGSQCTGVAGPGAGPVGPCRMSVDSVWTLYGRTHVAGCHSWASMFRTRGREKSGEKMK